MSDEVHTVDLPHGIWTPIASRPRDPRSALAWSPVPNAPIDLEKAHRLRRAGEIIMASRHSSVHIDLVVRPSATR
jgi:hypothetical protein